MAALSKNLEIVVRSTPEELFQFAAENFCQRAISTIKKKGIFTVVLSGGNTPKSLFDMLTGEFYKKQIPWQQIKFFFGDERYVPSDDSDSNYHMAYEHLFSKVPVLSENIYKIPTQFSDPKEAAANYESTIRNALHINSQEFPQFDLVYLGLGNDGHTASLMPMNELLLQYCDDHQEQNHQLAASLWFAKENRFRITLTPPVFNHAAAIIFLVAGTEKAAILEQVLTKTPDPKHYPAELIHPIDGITSWYLDEMAAALIGDILNES